MNLVNIIIEITVIALGVLMYFLFKNYLPSYYTEKGKNLATKEDINDITKIVESIKLNFNKDLETIKAELNFKNQSVLSIKSSERDALIETNLKLAEWLHYLMNISFMDINSENYMSLTNYVTEIRNRKLKYQTSEENLHLFLHDDELLEVKSECFIGLLKLEFIVMQMIGDMINHYYLEKIYFDGIMNLDNEQKKDTNWIRQQKISSKQELDKIFEKFNKDKLEQFRIIHEKRVIFVKTLKNRLYNIMK